MPPRQRYPVGTSDLVAARMRRKNPLPPANLVPDGSLPGSMGPTAPQMPQAGTINLGRPNVPPLMSSQRRIGGQTPSIKAMRRKIIQGMLGR